VQDFASPTDADEAAKRAQQAINRKGVSYHGDYIKSWDMIPVNVTITPPGTSPPLVENSPKGSANRSGSPAPTRPFVSGSLTTGDPANGGRHYKAYTFTVVRGVRYNVLLSSGTGQTQSGRALPGFFDPVLVVKDSRGGIIGQNDDINWPVNCNSPVSFLATYAGTIQIYVTSYRPGETGSFSLDIRTQ
jgi:hypothetical protein